MVTYNEIKRGVVNCIREIGSPLCRGGEVLLTWQPFFLLHPTVLCGSPFLIFFTLSCHVYSVIASLHSCARSFFLPCEFHRLKYGNYKLYNSSLLYYSLLRALSQPYAVLSVELNIDVYLSKKLRWFFYVCLGCKLV